MLMLRKTALSATLGQLNRHFLDNSSRQEQIQLGPQI
jgi:hypothetical protein